MAGNVGIGTTNPGEKLEVNGRIRMNTWTADGETAVYRDDATGDLGLVNSDIRLKKNITPLEDALGKISKLQGFLYNSIDEPDGAKKRLGLSAQDVMAVLPEAAFSFTGSDGQEYYSIHYEKLTALLVEGIKQQQVEIESLKSLLGVTELNSQGGLGPETPMPWLEAKIKQVLADLGLILENSIARIQEIITGKLTTQELCLDDVCVTKDQLKAMLQQNGQAAQAAIVPPPESPTPTPDVGAPDLTSGVEPTPTPSESPSPSPSESPSPMPSESPVVEATPSPSLEVAPVVESAPPAPAESVPAPVAEIVPPAPAVEVSAPTE